MNIWDEWLENAKKQAKEKKKAELASRPKGQKCSNCLHHLEHFYTKKINWCGLKRDNRTGHAFASTKRSSWCSKWEKK